MHCCATPSRCCVYTARGLAHYTGGCAVRCHLRRLRSFAGVVSLHTAQPCGCASHPAAAPCPHSGMHYRSLRLLAADSAARVFLTSHIRYSVLCACESSYWPHHTSSISQVLVACYSVAFAEARDHHSMVPWPPPLPPVVGIHRQLQRNCQFPDCHPTLLPEYDPEVGFVRIRTGTCDSMAGGFVTSYADCLGAARELQLQQALDPMRIDNSGYMPGCIYKIGSRSQVYFNEASSAITCSSLHNCICLAHSPPPPWPDKPPSQPPSPPLQPPPPSSPPWPPIRPLPPLSPPLSPLPPTPPSPPLSPPPMICFDMCKDHSGNGVCEDGGRGSVVYPGLCPYGDDCHDW